MMKKLWLVLIILALGIIGGDEYYHRQLVDLPNLQSVQRPRIIHHQVPHLQAPRDASQENHQEVLKRPIHYHGYFNSRNKKVYLTRVQHLALQTINNERTKRHLTTLKLSSHLNQVAAMRAVQANRHFDHYNRAGQVLSCLDAVKLRWLPSYMEARTHLSECLSEQAGDIDNTAPQVVHTAVNGMIYHDARSHWGHRKILLDPKNRYIGIVAYVNKNQDNKIVIAYELYQ